MDFTKYEPFLDDERVARIAEKVRSALGHRRLEGAEFVTFIQPPIRRQVKDELTGLPLVGTYRDIPEMAVFAVMSPNPRPYAKGTSILSTATASLEGWHEAETDRAHFVSGDEDPAFPIFRLVATKHLETMDNLRALI